MADARQPQSLLMQPMDQDRLAYAQMRRVRNVDSQTIRRFVERHAQDVIVHPMER